jgi:hypothetical protein
MMGLYYKNVMIDVKAHFGSQLEKLGLKMRAREEADGLTLIFVAGETSFSPLSIHFEGPKETGLDEASWKRAELNIRCFDFHELGNTGWIYWEDQGHTNAIEYDGRSKNKIFKDVEYYLDDCGIVEEGTGLPKIANSSEFVRTYYAVLESIPETCETSIQLSRNDDGCECISYRDPDNNSRQIIFPKSALNANGPAILFLNGERSGEIDYLDHGKMRADVAKLMGEYGRPYEPLL